MYLSQEKLVVTAVKIGPQPTSSPDSRPHGLIFAPVECYQNLNTFFKFSLLKGRRFEMGFFSFCLKTISEVVFKRALLAATSFPVLLMQTLFQLICFFSSAMGFSTAIQAVWIRLAQQSFIIICKYYYYTFSFRTSCVFICL